MNWQPVLYKSDFVCRYEAGEFGNRAPTWAGYPEWLQDNPPPHHLVEDDNGWRGYPLFHIRNRIANAMTWYNVPSYQMEETWTAACQQFEASRLYISAMAPTERTVLQGEVLNDVGGLVLRYSRVKKPMRKALAEGEQTANGLRARFLLQTACNAKSWEWLKILLERYPDHVVEFSCYSCCWGTEPGFNTVFWEVRKY